MSHFRNDNTRSQARIGLAILTPGEDSQFKRCDEHGVVMHYLFSGAWVCSVCRREEAEAEKRKHRDPTVVTQAQRRAIERHQHRDEDDFDANYWGD